MGKGCVIFDFDGVIADTESFHLAAYNAAFDRHADRIGKLRIPAEIYFSKYIMYGNREGFFHMLRDAGRPNDPATIEALCETKDALFDEELGRFYEPLPGVRALLAFLERHGVPRAICSGARGSEIRRLLGAFDLLSHFPVIVSIDDVRNGKPDPEGYNLAFQKLFVAADGALEKRHSLVIEDSAGGCAAGRAAGMRVLGVATTSPLSVVSQCADFAVENLGALSMADLAGWLGIDTTDVARD